MNRNGAEAEKRINRDTRRSMRDSISRFRKKWLDKFENDAFKILNFESSNGEIRRAFLVMEGDNCLDEFERKIRRLSDRMKSAYRIVKREGKITEMNLDSYKFRIFRNCSNLSLCTYVATSSREVSLDQARAFSRKAGVVLPENKHGYRMRTHTGSRYRLSVTTAEDAGIIQKNDIPFRLWIVIGCVHPYIEKNYNLTPSVPKTNFGKYLQSEPVAVVGQSKLYLIDEPTLADDDDENWLEVRLDDDLDMIDVD